MTFTQTIAESPATIQSKVAVQQAPLIVCIDDNPIICRIIEHIVTHAGYRFLAILDSLQAPQILGQVQPALVLLDLPMVGTNGRGLCIELRKSDLFKQLPIVALTDSNSFIECFRSKMAGATDLCCKPIASPKKVLALIRKHLPGKV